jgi:hypothetical protein
LRQVGSPSKESYRLLYRIKKIKCDQGPTKRCRTIIIIVNLPYLTYSFGTWYKPYLLFKSSSVSETLQNLDTPEVISVIAEADCS